MPEAVSILIPLLFLIVLKLSDISREVEITSIVEEDKWIIDGNVPYFGVFSVIHSLNTFILYFMLFGVVRTYEGKFFVEFYKTHSGGSYLVLISALTVALWLLLPVLELDRSQMSSVNTFEPMRYHIIYVTILFFLLHPMAYIHSQVQYSSPSTTLEALEISLNLLINDFLTNILLVAFQTVTMLIMIWGLGIYFIKVRTGIIGMKQK